MQIYWKTSRPLGCTWIRCYKRR